MKLPQMLMDFPYEEPELGNGKRRRWMVGAVLFLAIGLLGILGFMDELRAFSVIALSDGPKLTIAAAQVLLGLFGLFSLGCYLAWRKGKSVRVVYRRGQAVILALALAALAGHIRAGERAEDAFADPSYPRFLYISQAHSGWRKAAKRRGLTPEDLSRQP